MLTQTTPQRPPAMKSINSTSPSARPVRWLMAPKERSPHAKKQQSVLPPVSGRPSKHATSTKSLAERTASLHGKATGKQTLAECVSAKSRSSGCSVLLLNQKDDWAIIEQGSKDASASKSIAVDLYSQFNAQAAIDALNSEPSPSSTPGQTGGKVELLSGSETESTSP